FRKTQLGGPGVEARPWLDAQRRFMAEIARVLRPGGAALLIAGDGVVGGEAEDATATVARAGTEAGLEPVARPSQARARHERRLEAIFAGRPRREHLFLLRKER